MRKTKLTKKISVSISMDAEILNVVNNNYVNRSKFLEYCLLQELCKNDMIKEELKSKKIIL